MVHAAERGAGSASGQLAEREARRAFQPDAVLEQARPSHADHHPRQLGQLPRARQQHPSTQQRHPPHGQRPHLPQLAQASKPARLELGQEDDAERHRVPPRALLRGGERERGGAALRDGRVEQGPKVARHLPQLADARQIRGRRGRDAFGPRRDAVPRGQQAGQGAKGAGRAGERRPSQVQLPGEQQRRCRRRPRQSERGLLLLLPDPPAAPEPADADEPGAEREQREQLLEAEAPPLQLQQPDGSELVGVGQREPEPLHLVVELPHGDLAPLLLLVGQRLHGKVRGRGQVVADLGERRAKVGGRPEGLREGDDEGVGDRDQVGDTRGDLEGGRRPVGDEHVGEHAAAPFPKPERDRAALGRGEAGETRLVHGERHRRILDGVLEGDGQRGEVGDQVHGERGGRTAQALARRVRLRRVLERVRLSRPREGRAAVGVREDIGREAKRPDRDLRQGGRADPAGEQDVERVFVRRDGDIRDEAGRGRAARQSQAVENGRRGGGARPGGRRLERRRPAGARRPRDRRREEGPAENLFRGELGQLAGQRYQSVVPRERQIPRLG